MKILEECLYEDLHLQDLNNFIAQYKEITSYPVTELYGSITVVQALEWKCIDYQKYKSINGKFCILGSGGLRRELAKKNILCVEPFNFLHTLLFNFNLLPDYKVPLTYQEYLEHRKIADMYEI